MEVNQQNNRGEIFFTLVNPRPQQIPDKVDEFIRSLPGPTHIQIDGKDPDRCRVVTTLIHGNEPSGLYATYKLLRDGAQPAVNVHIFIVSVEAALAPPLFSHRMLNNRPDLNRCFRQPFSEDQESQLAYQLINTIDELKPEAVIDIHNTSGSGPAFGVTAFDTSDNAKLALFFSQRLVVTDLRIGALMEMSTPERPIVTVECGGSHDSESHSLAFHGLLNFVISDNVFSGNHDCIELYKQPMRVQVHPNISLAYDDEGQANVDLTLVSHIEEFNFGVVDQHTVLGFTGDAVLDQLKVVTATGDDSARGYFQVRDGCLHPTHTLKVFMVTTNIAIAKSDCLFYFVTLEE